jgi:hypothetical protein
MLVLDLRVPTAVLIVMSDARDFNECSPDPFTKNIKSRLFFYH